MKAEKIVLALSQAQKEMAPHKEQLEKHGVKYLIEEQQTRKNKHETNRKDT